MRVTFLAVACAVALAAAPVEAAPKAQLPLVIYAHGQSSPAYAASGWEGNAGAIKMNDQSNVKPHSGTACLKASFNAASGWGGVVWQSPANDWGMKPGGLNLSGAKRLTFWARGEKGGEKVSIVFGVLNKAKFPDTGSGKLDVTLTPAWKQYTISLVGKNLSTIKTGFGWIVAGKPTTFFLDDIRYQ